MKIRRPLAVLAGLLLTAALVLWCTELAGPDTTALIGWGGKAEHCAMAIGVIGAAMLSMFANPLAGPFAIGAMSFGLIWMVATCD